MQALVLFFKEDTSMKNDPHLLVMAGTQAVAKKHQKTSSFPPLITISHVWISSRANFIINDFFY